MQDHFGLDHTTSRQAAIDSFYASLDDYLGSRKATMSSIEATIAIDPNMPMAQVFRGYLLKLAADPRFKTPIADCCAMLKDNAQLNEREALHAQALNQLHDGQLISALKTLSDLVNRFPTDLLALRIIHYLQLYCAGGSEMTHSMQLPLDQWPTQDRFYGYLKGMQSFAFEEAGEYALAEQAGKTALELNPADIWAAHAVSHVYQMQSRFEEGIALIESLEEHWAGANNFVNHLFWHKALQYLGCQQYDAALALYDEKLIAPLADDFYLDICNAASLLLRFELLNIDVGDRWQDLTEYSRHRITDDELVFSTLHYLLAPARVGDQRSVTACIDHFDQWQNVASTQGRIAASVGASMAQAIAMIGQKKFNEGAGLLASVRDQIHLIGGSHAQRQLFDHHLITHHQN